MSGAEFVAVLGIIASAIQVAETGKNILSRIKDYRDNISAFQHIELQLPLLIQDVEALAQSSRQHGETSTPASQVDTSALARVLTGCGRQLNKLDKLVQAVTPLPSSSRSTKAFHAVRSYGKDAKIREAMGILSQYQITITMHLTARTTLAKSKEMAPTPAPKRVLSILPPIRLAHFVGRADILDQLNQILDKPDSNCSSIAVLTGIGGQGKTQVALEFCHRAAEKGATTLWMDAASPETVIRSFERIANEIRGQKEFNDSSSRISYVKEQLSSWDEPFVLVFDNYDDPGSFQGQELSSFFPTPSGPSKHIILVTSRVREAERLGTPIRVDGLSEAEAVELLSKRAMVSGSATPCSEEIQSAQIIVRNLGCLALAIDQAAAFIRSRNLSFATFIKHYDERKARVLAETPKVAWEYQRSDGIGSKAQALSVRTTWELSLSQISGEDREQIQEFLTQAAFFDPSSISENLFKIFQDSKEETLPEWMGLFTIGDEWDSFEFQETVALLANLSLIQNMTYSCDAITFSLHPLIKVCFSRRFSWGVLTMA
jgi:Mrp family chromosome partitioning ATPase